MRYLVIIRRTLAGYSVDVPDLQGCIVTGTTVEHSRQVIAGAIEMHLELMQQSGESVPIPTTSYEFAIDQDAAEELCTWVEIDESKSPVTP